MTPNTPVANKKKTVKEKVSTAKLLHLKTDKKTNVFISALKRMLHSIVRRYFSGWIEVSEKPGSEYFYMFFD